MDKLCIGLVNIRIGFENLLLKFIKFLLWPKNNVKNHQNICVYKLGNIGDLLCAIPALHRIREEYPEARITLLNCPGKKGNVGADKVLDCIDWLDEIVLYHLEDINNFTKITKFLGNLKSKKYDYLIQLPGEKTTFFTQLRNMMFFKLARVKYVDGFYISTVNWARRKQMLYIKTPNEVERLVNGLPFHNYLPIKFPINITYVDKEYVNGLFIKANITKKDKIMVISHSAKAKANIWPLERFKEISDKWIENGGKTIIIGGNAEYEDGQKITLNQEKDGYNFCGKCTIAQSLYLLTKARFLLTVETGTVHMASVMDVPSISISPSVYFPSKWAGYGKNNKIFRKNLECSPCLKKECRYGDNRCINAINVKEVWNYIEVNYLYN